LVPFGLAVLQEKIAVLNSYSPQTMKFLIDSIEVLLVSDRDINNGFHQKVGIPMGSDCTAIIVSYF
jgi:hypothetical protein